MEKELLECAVTYRTLAPKTEVSKSTFSNFDAARDEWVRVLLHEAREAMQNPMADMPEKLFMHPVDLDTDAPGIVCSDGDVLKPDHIAKIDYGQTRTASVSFSAPKASPPTIDHVSLEAAREAAEKELKRTQKKAETAAANAEKRSVRQAEEKRARAQETPEERAERLEKNREKRKQAEARKKDTPVSKKERSLAAPDGDDVVEDCLLDKVSKRPFKKHKIFSHPLPHHRHLVGIMECGCADALLPALLHGQPSTCLEIIQGPPGTGKTRQLVERAKPLSGSVLLCAPTNVGAANLYERVARDFPSESSLVVSRPPPGAAIVSNDPSRRIVCATISSRSSPALLHRDFDHVLVDEAGQCMEAWVWTLLRPSVKSLVLAGDVQQLSACVSDSGRAMAHHRSLMERLMELDYAHVTTLRVQHRMAPELLAFPNRHFYRGELCTGEGAPTSGEMEIVRVEDGRELQEGTSWKNPMEVKAVSEIVAREEEAGSSAVVLTPYLAQGKALLSLRKGTSVHTIDSYQGKEAEVIVLTTVRDGTSGLGFWQDPKRLTVALTRAKRKLILVCSPASWPSDTLLSELICQNATEGVP